MEKIRKVITRTEYCRSRNYYRLDVDEEFVKRLNEDISDRLVDKELVNNSPFPLTIDDVMNIYNGEENEKYDITLKLRNNAPSYPNYSMNLIDYVNDYINDSIWDSWVDSDNYDTEDYEDEVYTEVEKDGVYVDKEEVKEEVEDK